MNIGSFDLKNSIKSYFVEVITMANGISDGTLMNF